MIQEIHREWLLEGYAPFPLVISKAFAKTLLKRDLVRKKGKSEVLVFTKKGLEKLRFREKIDD